jgi:hypothetical protein
VLRKNDRNSYARPSTSSILRFTCNIPLGSRNTRGITTLDKNEIGVNISTSNPYTWVKDLRKNNNVFAITSTNFHLSSYTKNKPSECFFLKQRKTYKNSRKTYKKNSLKKVFKVWDKFWEGKRKRDFIASSCNSPTFLSLFIGKENESLGYS